MRGDATVALAASAGFCYGVRRAVDAVLRELEDGCGAAPLATFGPIIHNPDLVERLAQQGVRVIGEPDEAAGMIVVIRAHGVPLETERALRANALRVVDATCPHVKRIHALAQQAETQGVPLLIAGDRDHPEIQGIAGYASRVYVLQTMEDIERLEPMEAAHAVAQTTLRPALWQELVGGMRGKVADLKVHDTICNATQVRQAEAEDLAASSDTVIVVGGRNSANTKHLYDLCRARCANTHWLQSAREISGIPPHHFRGKISITAGASTPDWILKEVLTTMTDIENKDMEQPEVPQEITDPDKDTSFQDEFEKTLVQIRPGFTVKGTIVQVTEDEVCVNIGYKSDGLIPKNELAAEGDPRLNYRIGEEIEVEVIKVNDGEGNVLLSQNSLSSRKNWDMLVEKHEQNQVVEGIGKEMVKGGLIANVMGIRTFIPASQLSDRYVEKIEEFIGQPMRLRIIEVDRQKRRFVASRKQVLVEEKAAAKEQLWSTLSENATVHGVVRRLTDFGAFVDIGGLDGLVHVTDLSWARVKHPSDVIKIGDEIDVLVLSLDREKERISLSLKHLQPKPWDNAVEKYPVGTIVEGTVVRIQPFGAFVQLEPGLDGLVHISQIAAEHVAKVEDKISIGQTVNAKVLDVNPETKRISLSIREAAESMRALQQDATDGAEYVKVEIEEAVPEVAAESIDDVADEAEAGAELLAEDPNAVG